MQVAAINAHLSRFTSTNSSHAPRRQLVRVWCTAFHLHIAPVAKYVENTTSTDILEELSILFANILRVMRVSSLELRLLMHTHESWQLKFEHEVDANSLLAPLISPAVVSNGLNLYPYFKYQIEGPRFSNIELDLHWSALDDTAWRISNANIDYSISSKMPKKLFVPASISDAQLSSSSKFRGAGVAPHVVYCHSASRAIIAKSGQPMIGQKSARCSDDEDLLQKILQSPTTPFVVDARSKSAVEVAKQRGGGNEIDGSYNGFRMFFTNIETPEELSVSFDKLSENIRSYNTNSMSSYMSVASTWLKQIQSCLRPALFVAKSVSQESVSCLVHDDYGCDCSLIVISLSKLLMDPFYRTYKGFKNLISEDWINGGYAFGKVSHTNGGDSFVPEDQQSFGHKLSSTLESMNLFNSVDSALPGNTHYSPVFYLFLDCVHQIWSQFCSEFEFNLEYLCCFYSHSISSPFGDFLGVSTQNSHETMADSIFAFLVSPGVRTMFTNYLYSPSNQSKLLLIQTNAKILRVWRGALDPNCKCSDMRCFHDVKFAKRLYEQCRSEKEDLSLTDRGQSSAQKSARVVRDRHFADSNKSTIVADVPGSVDDGKDCVVCGPLCQGHH